MCRCECLGRAPEDIQFRPSAGWPERPPPLESRGSCKAFMFHANLAARLAAILAPVLAVGCRRLASRRIVEQRWHLVLDRPDCTGLTAGSVCVSRWCVCGSAATLRRLDPARLTVIPNGIDASPCLTTFRPDLYPARLSGVPDDCALPRFPSAALTAQKGLPDLLQAAEQVIAQRSDWHLALAGDGPCRNWLLQQIADPFFVTQQRSLVGPP